MFNIQRFGDNDTITSSRELKLVYYFTDGDTRTTSLQNPKTNLTSDNIVTAATVLKNTQAFIGDKASAAFETIKSAEVVETMRKQLDLS